MDCLPRRPSTVPERKEFNTDRAYSRPLCKTSVRPTVRAMGHSRTQPGVVNMPTPIVNFEGVNNLDGVLSARHRRRGRPQSLRADGQPVDGRSTTRAAHCSTARSIQRSVADRRCCRDQRRRPSRAVRSIGRSVVAHAVRAAKLPERPVLRMYCCFQDGHPHQCPRRLVAVHLPGQQHQDERLPQDQSCGRTATT